MRGGALKRVGSGGLGHPAMLAAWRGCVNPQGDRARLSPTAVPALGSRLRPWDMTESSTLSTAAIADATLRLGVPARYAPTGIRPLFPSGFAGLARPVTHLGSVEVFLEVIDDASPGDVLVIDNGGRDDEACVGDLVTLEAREAGLAGIVIWGRHRDTAQLREIGLPVFSTGSFPFGPRRIPPAGRAMRSAMLDGVAVTESDFVVADEDGVLFRGRTDATRSGNSPR